MSTKPNQDPKIAFPNARDRIVFAFELNGIAYFQFDDINSIPCERGFHALSFFNELNQRCTRDYLMAHSTALDNIINDNTGIKVTEIVKINTILKERLEFLFEPEIAYKICSVVFFDASENPYRFEYKHALEKADRFRKENINDFFLSQPITRLIPYIASFGNDLEAYCSVVNAMTTKHIEIISTMLSEADKKKEWFKSLELLLLRDLTLTPSKT